ncbi:MAG: acetyl-CoA carboxylase biotin carboxylase subunit [Bacteroidota bacterium]
MFKKILIANRGEIALRIIRACQELGIATVAVYSTADRESLPVSFADEAVCIGPPPSHLSYLNIVQIIAAAEVTNACAIHPGYGFLSENPLFPQVCREHDIQFIGPSAEAMRKMGDKMCARATMQQAGIPIVPGSDGLLTNPTAGLELAGAIGFPIVLKATAGGGGKGMKIVQRAQDFPKAWAEAQAEAQISFNNAGLYLEKRIEAPRHVEIQLCADRYGQVGHMSERDCSIQRKHQKLIEETPAPGMTEVLRKKMIAATRQGVAAIGGYEGVGTVEFLVDQRGGFYFIEMNTRIQVEHPVTEAVTGLDLIKQQIRVAAGEKLGNVCDIPRGHAIECRINAEDPSHNFRPSPGTITDLHLPGGHGIRVDTHVYAGYTIPQHYDALIAKIIAHGQDRAEAIQRMHRALAECSISGIKTTLPLHRHIMQDQTFRAGQAHTAFLDTFDRSSL